ncbi:MAG: Uma2 family endonuclease [Saprospiraceae bacterium]
METVLVETSYEIERGKPMPSINHSIVQANLIGLFFTLYKKYRVASELNIIFGGVKKVPDVVLYDKMEFRPGQDEINATKPPLCAIEILSPKQHLSELLIKSHLYFENGVKSYWLVVPDLQTIYIFKNINDYEVFHQKERLIDKELGIELELVEIFS